MERLTKKHLCSYTNMDFYSIQMDWSSIYNKLAEFEDFMEEYNLDFKQLKQIIEWLSNLNGNDAEQMQFICQERAKIFNSNKKLKQENQALKDKMQELEKE